MRLTVTGFINYKTLRYSIVNLTLNPKPNPNGSKIKSKIMIKVNHYN